MRKRILSEDPRALQGSFRDYFRWYTLNISRLDLAEFLFVEQIDELAGVVESSHLLIFVPGLGTTTYYS